MTKSILVDYALKFVGLPYIWGGYNFEGYDCSGLVLELLRSQGKIDSRDYTAQSLYKHLKEQGWVKSIYPDFGALSFYGEGGKITHVAMLLSPNEIIEAGGGNSFTKTKMEAAKKNACVRVRTLGHRSDLIDITESP